MRLDNLTDAWELEDAEERERIAPDLYPLPDIDERTSLRVGDRADLFFLFRGRDQHGPFIQSERLPVIVCSFSPTGYAGTLELAPVSSNLLRVGDSISFEVRHVSRIHRAGSPGSGG